MDGVQASRPRRRRSTGRRPRTRSSTQPPSRRSRGDAGSCRARVRPGPAVRREPLVALARLRLGRLARALGQREPRPEVVEHAASSARTSPSRPKSSAPGGEDLRAGRRLVVRHLRGRSRARTGRGSARARSCPGGDSGVVASISIPKPPTNCAERRAVGRGRCPPTATAPPAAFCTMNEPLVLAVVVRAVLHADQPRLGPARVAPLADLAQRLALRLSTCQKKLFAERNIRLPPRSR